MSNIVSNDNLPEGLDEYLNGQRAELKPSKNLSIDADAVIIANEKKVLRMCHLCRKPKHEGDCIDNG